jgi:hypothetical protein
MLVPALLRNGQLAVGLVMDLLWGVVCFCWGEGGGGGALGCFQGGTFSLNQVLLPTSAWVLSRGSFLIDTSIRQSLLLKTFSTPRTCIRTRQTSTGQAKKEASAPAVMALIDLWRWDFVIVPKSKLERERVCVCREGSGGDSSTA